MAQRNRKKRQEEVERYQKLKTKTTVLLRPAPAQQSNQGPDGRPRLLATSDEDAGTRARATAATGSASSLISRKRKPRPRKQDPKSRGDGRSGKDLGMPMIKKEPGSSVYLINAVGKDEADADEEECQLVKKEQSLTPSPLTPVAPWSHVGQGSSDPFTMMSTRVTGRMQEYIHYCTLTTRFTCTANLWLESGTISLAGLGLRHAFTAS